MSTVVDVPLFDLVELARIDWPRVGDTVRRGAFSRLWKVVQMLPDYEAWGGRSYVKLVATPKAADSVNEVIVYVSEVLVVRRARSPR